MTHFKLERVGDNQLKFEVEGSAYDLTSMIAALCVDDPEVFHIVQDAISVSTEHLKDKGIPLDAFLYGLDEEE